MCRFPAMPQSDMSESYSYQHTNLNDGVFNSMNWGGSGAVALICHSIGFCAGVYTPLATLMTDHFQVQGFDSRGHGRTKAPADPENLKNWNIFYDDMEGFCQHIGRPVIAIGHSMGGTVSMVAAVRRPELVRALIMIEPGIIPPEWILRTYLMQKCGLTGLAPIVSKTVKRKNKWPDREALRDHLSTNKMFLHWKRAFIDAYIEHMIEDTDTGAVQLRCDPRWEARCIATAPTDIWHYVPKLKIPTLIIYGTQTRTFLPSVIKRFKTEVPHAVLRCFEGPGHNVVMEKPRESAEAILEFLRENVN
jgi:pimeloyl-ACP methyl ester carboxylesterase